MNSKLSETISHGFLKVQIPPSLQEEKPLPQPPQAFGAIALHVPYTQVAKIESGM